VPLLIVGLFPATILPLVGLPAAATIGSVLGLGFGGAIGIGMAALIVGAVFAGLAIGRMISDRTGASKEIRKLNIAFCTEVMITSGQLSPNITSFSKELVKALQEVSYDDKYKPDTVVKVTTTTNAESPTLDDITKIQISDFDIEAQVIPTLKAIAAKFAEVFKNQHGELSKSTVQDEEEQPKPAEDSKVKDSVEAIINKFDNLSGFYEPNQVTCKQEKLDAAIIKAVQDIGKIYLRADERQRAKTLASTVQSDGTLPPSIPKPGKGPGKGE